MGVTLHQSSSRILSALLFLAIIGAVRLTSPDEEGGVLSPATISYDTPAVTGKPSQQHEYTVLPTASPRPPDTSTDAWEQYQGLEKQNGALNRYWTLELPRYGVDNRAEVVMSPSNQPVLGNYEHTDYAQYGHYNLIPAASETAYLRAKRNVETDLPRITTRTTPPTDAPSSQMSTLDNMFLCDHPPETFSPNFLGFSWDVCLRHDRKFVQPVTDTMIICNAIFSLTESDPQSFSVGRYYSDVGPLIVITHESYVKSCLPLFRRFNNCEEREFLTICWEEKVVFLHSLNCPLSSNDIFLAGFLLTNNTHCFHEFCEGWQSVVDDQVGGLLYRLTNTKYDPNSPSCGSLTKSLSHIYRQYNGTLYIIVNNHWPCCYPLYVVIWAGLPETHGLNGAWSFLSPACQAGEVLLLVLVGCVMIGSIGGNLLVMVVMMSGGHRGQESSLLRTSLAFSNLLTATFVIVPAFVQHLRPFLSTPHYFTASPEMQLTTNPENETNAIYITNALHGWSGFPLFQSILFNTTSTVSLLMLLVLSLERFVITRRYMRYRDYFSYRRIVLAIIVAWITSFTNALWFAATEEGGLGAQWLTFEKLPTGASGFGPGGTRNVIYHGQFVIFLILGITVAVFSALAIYNFAREQLQVAAEWRSLKMKASRQYSRDNRYVLTTMTLMLVLFLTSTLPLAINIAINSTFHKFHQQTLFSYLSWWLFAAATAWNPWVYNLRSHQFKEDLRKFHHQAKRVCRQQRSRDDSMSSPTSLPTEGFQLATRSR